MPEILSCGCEVKLRRDKLRCSKCGQFACPKHTYSRVDESNWAITKNAYLFCVNCAFPSQLTCGNCGEITTVESSHTCKTCGRLLCGSCGAFCKDHKAVCVCENFVQEPDDDPGVCGICGNRPDRKKKAIL